jgi:putative ATPase
MEDVRQTRNDPVPLHLRNPVTGLMQQMGYGKDYKYAHDYPGHFVLQDFLPPNLKGRRYYQPAEQGHEKEIAERVRKWWGEWTARKE